MRLHFALGKAYLDAGDNERSFTHFAEGNRMKRATITYDPDAIEQWMKAIAQQHTRTLFEELKGAGEPSEIPIFVVGMARSGTTLMEQILASHPQIHGAGELPYMDMIVRQIQGSDGQNQPYPEFVALLQSDQLKQMGRLYLTKITPLADNASRIVDKSPSNLFYAGLIHLVLPGARIIHVHRDPVDTCLSCYTRLFVRWQQSFSYDLAELGRFCRNYEALAEHWRHLLPPSSLLDIEYEKLVEDLEAHARRLIAFCGLPWDDACLRFYETERPVLTASMNQVRRPIYKSSIGRWKRYSPYLGPLLEALGPFT